MQQLRLELSLENDGYEEPLDKPKEVVVETISTGVFLSIPELPMMGDVSGSRVLLEYHNEAKVEDEPGPGWYLYVWADGDSEYPQKLYLSKMTEEEELPRDCALHQTAAIAHRPSKNSNVEESVNDNGSEARSLTLEDLENGYQCPHCGGRDFDLTYLDCIDQSYCGSKVKHILGGWGEVKNGVGNPILLSVSCINCRLILFNRYIEAYTALEEAIGKELSRIHVKLLEPTEMNLSEREDLAGKMARCDNYHE